MPEVAIWLKFLATLDELSDSPVIKSQHRIVFEKIKENYKQCYETDPDEEEPSPIELFLELKKVYNEPQTQEQLQENDLIENTQSPDQSANHCQLFRPSSSPDENLQLTNPQQRVTEEYKANFQLIAQKNSGHIPHGGLSITPNEWTSANGGAPADFDGILRNEESLRQQVIIGPFITQEDQNHTSSTSNQQSVASINPQHLLISHSSTPTNHWSNTNNSTEEDNSAVHNHNLRSLKIKKRNPLEDSVDDNPRSNGMIEGRVRKRAQRQTDASDNQSTTSSVNKTLPSHEVSRLDNYKLTTLIEQTLPSVQQHCVQIIKLLNRICGKLPLKNLNLQNITSMTTEAIMTRLKNGIFLPPADLLLNSEVIDFDLLKELQYTSMAKTELLPVILRPAAENSPSAYRHLEAFIKEISAEIKFNKSDTRAVNLFKNINTKSNKAFGIAFEEISTVVGQYSHSFKSEVDEEGNTISIGSGVGSVVDFFSHCIHGLFFLWLHNIPEKDHPVLKSFAADANLKCQQRSLYCLSNFLLIGPRAIFTTNNNNPRKQTRWHSTARLDLTSTLISNKLKEEILLSPDFLEREAVK
ncbi:hypothetical protein BY996DRAFT_6422875 [Phakopsora pachyrhizi]|nr:hypothetical protein BY996DRAFT_6422875 [Phakopsora pachyrhizi]